MSAENHFMQIAGNGRSGPTEATTVSYWRDAAAADEWLAGEKVVD